MSKIARYQGNVRAFASNAQGMERTVFGGTNQADDLTSQITASFLRGWGIVGASEHPSLEDFNAAMYAMSQFIAYQHQMGVPEWHAEQEYHIGSICTHNGESYQSLQNANIGSQPPSAKWTPVLTSKNGLANLGLGTAAKRNVDAGIIDGIPDMSSFRSLMIGNGYVRIPTIGGGGGAQSLIIQWGVHSTAPGSNAAYNLNIAFPTGILWATGGRGAPGSNAPMNVGPEGTQQIRIQNYAPGGVNENCFWLAIGY
ncbi:gp53-like domain-containing protein [Citrobacter braakii]|uniref:gp53-like domain-containing protein n=1 Tax=Citrobacter braakii TaxID=57706 RepID=UPI00397A420A